MEDELIIRELFLGFRKQYKWVCQDLKSAMRIKNLVDSLRLEFKGNGYLDCDVVTDVYHDTQYYCEVKRR